MLSRVCIQQRSAFFYGIYTIWTRLWRIACRPNAHVCSRRMNLFGEYVLHSVQDLFAYQAECLNLAKNALDLSKFSMKEYHHVRHRKPDFNVTERVWILATQGAYLRRIEYPSSGTIDTSSPKQLEPFNFVSNINGNTFKLDILFTMHIHPIIHARYLILYTVSTRYHKKTPVSENPMITEDPHLEFEVERIFGKRVRKVSKGMWTEYLIIPGNGQEDDAYKPLKNLHNTLATLQELEASPTEERRLACKQIQSIVCIIIPVCNGKHAKFHRMLFICLAEICVNWSLDYEVLSKPW